MKHSNFSRFLSVLLALVMVLSMFPATVFAADSATAELVTDVSTLAAGDQVVIVAADYDYALGTNQKSNNRSAVAVTKSGSPLHFQHRYHILLLHFGLEIDGNEIHIECKYSYHRLLRVLRYLLIPRPRQSCALNGGVSPPCGTDRCDIC